MADPALPGATAVRRWRRRRPDFARAVKAAQVLGHRRRMAAGRRLTPDLRDQILERLASGASLRQVSFAPGMPHVVTLYGWVKRDPQFARMVDWARAEGRWAEAEPLLAWTGERPRPLVEGWRWR